MVTSITERERFIVSYGADISWYKAKSHHTKK